MNFFTFLSIFLIFSSQFSSLVSGDGSDVNLGKRDAAENDLGKRDLIGNIQHIFGIVLRETKEFEKRIKFLEKKF